MSHQNIVIIGASQAGLQAAISLRQEGHKGKITLIGAEPGLPYQRPPLSKAFLKDGEAERLTLRPQAFFKQNQISLITDTKVNSIRPATNEVLTDDRCIAYDHLILATGTRNLKPPIKGIENTISLRTLEDAISLRHKLRHPRKIAVIGGGFIGLEFAAVARKLGHQVTLAEASPRLMARAVSAHMSSQFLNLHKNLGTDINLNTPVMRVNEAGIVSAGGMEITADLVLLAVGVMPNTELAQAIGLAVENGIVVDKYLSTSDPNISAIGDCAAFPDPHTGKLVRLESVQAACDHARLIAKRIVHNAKIPYNAVPWFWSDQDDWKLQIAGLALPTDETVANGDHIAYRFSGRCSGSRLTAVETINDAKTHMKARRLLAANIPTREQLENVAFDLALV